MCSLEKRGNIYILTLEGTGEHRLNPTLMSQIHSAISQITSELHSGSGSGSGSGSALVTTAEGKFFSNGYDLDWATSESLSDGKGKQFSHRAAQMDAALRSLFLAFAALPIPTVAAVTGHACAAGMILALAHDYVVVRRDRGFMYMSELDIGLFIPRWFVQVVRSRVASPAAHRRLILAAAKVSGGEAVEMGMAESAHDGIQATVAAAVEMAEGLATKGWNGEVYAHTRSELFHEVLDEIKLNSPLVLSKM